jgi:hypothetical protein
MRGFIAGVLVVFGLVLVPFAVLGVWMQREILPTDAFTDLSTEIVRQEPVRDALANRFLDELQEREPRLALGRIVLEPAVQQAIQTPQFEQAFRTSVGTMHEQLVDGDDQLSLNLDSLLPIVKDLVAEVNTTVANQIPTSAGLPEITVVRKDDAPQIWFGVEVTREASWVFPLFMVIVFAGAVLISSKRALTLIISGFGVAFICLLFGLALRTGRDLLSDYVGSVVDVAAFDAGYDVVTDSIVGQALLVGLVGLVAGIAGVVWLLVGRANSKPPAWA